MKEYRITYTTTPHGSALRFSTVHAHTLRDAWRECKRTANAARLYFHSAQSDGKYYERVK